MTRLAQLIAQQEGFFKPGSIPRRDHNPGDLKHSPHSKHLAGDPNGIGHIDNDEDGFADLEAQLKRYADQGLTVGMMIHDYAPPSENNTGQYMSNICAGLKCSPTTLVKDVLVQPALVPDTPDEGDPAMPSADRPKEERDQKKKDAGVVHPHDAQKADQPDANEGHK